MLSAADMTGPSWVPIDAGVEAQDVLTEGDIGSRYPLGESVVDHRARPRRRLLGRLEQGDEVPCHVSGLAGEQLGRTEQAGDMDVVPAGVGHPDRAPASSVAVAVDAYGRPVSSATGNASMSARHSTVLPGAVRQDADDTATETLDLEAPLVESLGGGRRGAGFPAAQLGVGVQVAVEVLPPAARAVQPGEHLVSSTSSLHLSWIPPTSPPVESTVPTCALASPCDSGETAPCPRATVEAQPSAYRVGMASAVDPGGVRDRPSVLLLLDLAGTAVFALNGALTAIRAARLDIVGVLTLGMITALGGGIIRDVLIGTLPPAHVQRTGAIS